MTNWISLLNEVKGSTQDNIGQEFKYLLQAFRNSSKVSSIFKILSNQYDIEIQLNQFAPDGKIMRHSSISTLDFSCKEEQILCQMRILELLDQSDYPIKNYVLHLSKGNNNNEKLRNFIGKYIEPVIIFINKQEGSERLILNLLNRYKQRVQWFTKQYLREKYYNATKNYEEIFEDDLRLFLFDNGIQYPFSTPKLSKGRADIIGQIESNNPLIAEVKILDKNKKYSKNRIRDGFKQIVDYTTKYEKNQGYLIIYSLDDNLIEFTFNNDQSSYTSINYNGKVYYLIVVYLSDISPSKLGSTETLQVTKEEVVE